MNFKPDIIRTIENEGIELRQRGKSFWALCPFHTEKTSSFSVNPEKQVFHCFSCGKGGDAIAFIMELKGLSFKDTLVYLNMRPGNKVIRISQETKQKDAMKRFQAWLKTYHHYLLNEYQIIDHFIFNYIRNEDDLDVYGDYFSYLKEFECQLEIIEHGNEEDKWLLLKNDDPFIYRELRKQIDGNTRAQISFG